VVDGVAERLLEQAAKVSVPSKAAAVILEYLDILPLSKDAGSFD
jgi:hypothetical protein